MNEGPIIILERKIDTLVERVEQLEREVVFLREQRAAASLGSYSAIGASSAASSVAGDTTSIASNDYNTLAETIPPVPQEVLRACSLLKGGGIPFADRAARAWEAGYVGRAPHKAPSHEADQFGQSILRCVAGRRILLPTPL